VTGISHCIPTQYLAKGGGSWNLALHTKTKTGMEMEMEEVLVLVVLASTSISSTIASTGQGGGMHLISQITSYKSYLDLLWS